MHLNTISKDKIKNKKVLVRVDFNVPVEKKEHKTIVKDDTRIKNALKTIQFLLQYDAQVILISHLGRPNGEFDLNYTLLPAAQRLSQLLDREILFTTLNEALNDKLTHSVVMLENLRFYKGEKENDLQFAKKLASLADVYVNESFSTSHRSHASVEAITQLLPSYAGFALSEEANYLSQLIENPRRPFVVVVGGAKISDKVSAIKKLSQIADTVLVGGGVSNNFLKAEGFDIASSYMQDIPADEKKVGTDFVKFANKLLDQNRQEFSLLKNLYPIPKIVYPIDVIAAKSIDSHQTETINLLDPKNKDVADELMFLDIGPKTSQLFCQIIDQAKTIFFNGPMGVFERELFAHGTKKVAKAIANSGAKTIIGGGDTIRAIDELNLEKKYSYISTAGGASLELLSGKMLPGLKPLLLR